MRSRGAVRKRTPIEAWSWTSRFLTIPLDDFWRRLRGPRRSGMAGAWLPPLERGASGPGPCPLLAKSAPAVPSARDRGLAFLQRFSAPAPELPPCGPDQSGNHPQRWRSAPCAVLCAHRLIAACILPPLGGFGQPWEPIGHRQEPLAGKPCKRPAMRTREALQDRLRRFPAGPACPDLLRFGNPSNPKLRQPRTGSPSHRRAIAIALPIVPVPPVPGAAQVSGLWSRRSPTPNPPVRRRWPSPKAPPPSVDSSGRWLMIWA